MAVGPFHAVNNCRDSVLGWGGVRCGRFVFVLLQETNKLQLTTIQLTTRHYIHSAKQRQRLIKIIKDIKLDLPIHANNLLLSEWLNNSYQTLEARLKTERIGSINRIYNQGTVPSLLRKRKSLEKEKVKIGEETMVVLEQLEKYQSMEKKNDLKFQEIALEFTKVRNEVAIARQHLIAVTNGMEGSGIEDKNEIVAMTDVALEKE